MFTQSVFYKQNLLWNNAYFEKNYLHISVIFKKRIYKNIQILHYDTSILYGMYGWQGMFIGATANEGSKLQNIISIGGDSLRYNSQFKYILSSNDYDIMKICVIGISEMCSERNKLLKSNAK